MGTWRLVVLSPSLQLGFPGRNKCSHVDQRLIYMGSETEIGSFLFVKACKKMKLIAFNFANVKHGSRLFKLLPGGIFEGNPAERAVDEDGPASAA